MADAVQSAHSETPELSDLGAPSVKASIPTLSGPPVPPQLRVSAYESGEWEEFIREWATALPSDYVQIKRIGGAGDQGVDVAAFKTDQGFEGAWDCFQGKHYSKELSPSLAYPEMLKVFLGVVRGSFTLPDQYAFLAPKGCGTTLDRLLSKPTELRAKFLADLDNDKGCATALKADDLDRVRALAQSTDFSMFQSVQLLDALEAHRTTPYYVARFGGPLPPRPAIPLPPEQVAPHEARYVEQLVEVYREQSTDGAQSHEELCADPSNADHFMQQRISFYSAEALRLHARDSVPEGTFEGLQDDVFSGVVDVADQPHETGLDRLREVLIAVTKVQLDGHSALLSVSRMNDRKGICHQLANIDRLTWVRAQS
ncbi:hypothetical protein G7075_15295 [Phycicoccus sp. HDW14]|uniref:ABC-three component system protein n=1 Tax=Phycicoccus sp. HDW14 TaxID=2714941 RepID=UPI00140D661E|nr:ABC-three component system protein [Phycicoccus sp. HDW14]QIM22184.1 hypothetical protein G7075_15295 [Phycicoccus sp. HDW14]